MQTWTIAPADRVAARIIDGEAVLIDFETNLYFSLNASGTQIWRLLEGGAQSTASLSQALASAYAAEPAEEELAAFLADLAENALIVEASGAAGNAELDGNQADYEAPALTRYDTLDKLIVCGE